MTLKGNTKETPNWRNKNISGRIHANTYPFLSHLPSISNTDIHQNEARLFSEYPILVHCKAAGQRHPSLCCCAGTELLSSPPGGSNTPGMHPSHRTCSAETRSAEHRSRICKYLQKPRLSKAAGPYIAAPCAAIRCSSFSLNKDPSLLGTFS